MAVPLHNPIHTDVLIIGAGPTGLFQAFQLGVLGIRSQVVDVLPQAGGQCLELYPDKGIYDIPGLPFTTGRGLIESLLTQLQPFTNPAPTSPFQPPVGLHFNELVTQVMKNGPASDAAQWIVATTHRQFHCHAVVIAAGVGAFMPKKPALIQLDRFEGQQVLYHPPALESLAGFDVVIQGDSDLALTQAIALAHSGPHTVKSITLLHRRHAFTASESVVQQFEALRGQGRLRFLAGQVTAIQCNDQNEPDRMTGLELSLPDGSTTLIPAQRYLPLLGLSPQLGPIQQWGLAMVRKQVPVNHGTCETHCKGLYAVGDINQYTGKRKLIVSGFQDATLAAYAIAESIGGHPLPVQYTSANKALQSRLGVA